MRSFGLWRIFTLLAAVVVVAVVFSAATGIFWLAAPVLMIAGIWLFVAFAGRQPDKPPPAMPVPSLEEPSVLEGRVDRMTVEEAETATNPGTPWEGTQMMTVYVIVISGLRYRMDPRPARRGAFDWLQEGMWVRGTFDRRTRVIYNLEWIPAPA